MVNCLRLRRTAVRPEECLEYADKYVVMRSRNMLCALAYLDLGLCMCKCMVLDHVDKLLGGCHGMAYSIDLLLGDGLNLA